MTAPRPPRIRLKTDEEKAAAELDQQRHALDAEVRQIVDIRTASVATASPYDLLSDALMGCVTDAVFAALHSPDFAAALAERGYTVAPVVPDEQVPGAPDEWFHEAIDLYGLTGKPTEMVERVQDLWERAWRAGKAAQ